MAVVAQPVLPLIPAEATPIGAIAALVDKAGEGGVVYVNGLATFVSTPAMRWGASRPAWRLRPGQHGAQRDIAQLLRILSGPKIRYQTPPQLLRVVDDTGSPVQSRI